VRQSFLMPLRRLTWLILNLGLFPFPLEELYAERGGEAQANRWDGQEAPVVGGMVCERRIV
jgi:hypothetical protein